ELPEARILGHDRTPRREVADAPVAEPAAPGADVDVLRDRELAPRSANEVAIAVDVAGDRARIDELPPGAGDAGPDGVVERVHRQAEALRYPAREVEEAEEVRMLRPLIRRPAEGDVLPLVLPRRDRREMRPGRVRKRLPAVEHDGRPRRLPREPRERHGTVRRAQVLPVREQHVVAREERER